MKKYVVVRGESVLVYQTTPAHCGFEGKPFFISCIPPVLDGGYSYDQIKGWNLCGGGSIWFFRDGVIFETDNLKELVAKYFLDLV